MHENPRGTGHLVTVACRGQTVTVMLVCLCASGPTQPLVSRGRGLVWVCLRDLDGPQVSGSLESAPSHDRPAPEARAARLHTGRPRGSQPQGVYPPRLPCTRMGAPGWFWEIEYWFTLTFPNLAECLQEALPAPDFGGFILELSNLA